MYESFYGFRERPFDLTPNPRFLVMTDVHRRPLLSDAPRRLDNLHLELGVLLVDFSKNRVTAETMKLLYALARAQKIEEWRDKMFNGE